MNQEALQADRIPEKVKFRLRHSRRPLYQEEKEPGKEVKHGGKK